MGATRMFADRQTSGSSFSFGTSTSFAFTERTINGTSIPNIKRMLMRARLSRNPKAVTHGISNGLVSEAEQASTANFQFFSNT